MRYLEFHIHEGLVGSSKTDKKNIREPHIIGDLGVTEASRPSRHCRWVITCQGGSGIWRISQTETAVSIGGLENRYLARKAYLISIPILGEIGIQPIHKVKSEGAEIL